MDSQCLGFDVNAVCVSPRRDLVHMSNRDPGEGKGPDTAGNGEFRFPFCPFGSDL